ncbi:MAG: hypothetical protein ABJ242_07975 [Marinomonas sp.]
MPTFSDFSSLVQLGAAVGIGLSLFRAPIEGRLKALNAQLSSEIGAIDGLNSEKARQRRRKVYGIRLKANLCEQRVKKRAKPLLGALIFGAIINVLTLICFGFVADQEIDSHWFAFTIFTTVLYYPSIYLFLSILALEEIGPIQQELDEMAG